MNTPPKLVIGFQNPDKRRNIVLPTNNTKDDDYEYIYDYDEEEDDEIDNEEYYSDQFPGVEINNFDESSAELNNQTPKAPAFQIGPNGKLIDINSNISANNNNTSDINDAPNNMPENTNVNNPPNIKPVLPEGINIVLAKHGQLSEKIELHELEKKKADYELENQILTEKLNNMDPNNPNPSQNLPSLDQIDFKTTLSLKDADYLFLLNTKSIYHTIESDAKKGSISNLKTNLNIAKSTKNNANIKIELPSVDHKVQLTWQQKAQIPIFTSKKLSTLELKKHLKVQKDGEDLLKDEIDVFDDLSDIEEEEEEKHEKLNIPNLNIELPKKGGEDIMHEVNLIDLDNKVRTVRYIMLPNLNAADTVPITVQPRSQMQIEPLVMRHTYYTIDELRKIKQDMIENNLLATAVKRTAGLETLYRLHVEMKNPTQMRGYGLIRSGTLEISSQSTRSKQNQNTSTIITPGKSYVPKKDENGEEIKDNYVYDKSIGPKVAMLQQVVQITDPTDNGKAEDKFVPTIFAKTAGIWDENSEEVYKALTKKTFNRLTSKTVKDVLKEFPREMNTDEKVDFAVNVLVNKGRMEPAFASVYAQFAAECPVPEFRVKVVQEVINAFFQVVANPGRADRDKDVEDAVGTASFFAALIGSTAMQEQNGFTAVEQLLTNIAKPECHTTHIEMLNKFFSFAGYEFIKKLDGNVWKSLNEQIQRKDIKPRYHFLLAEIFEIRSKLERGQQDAVLIGKASEAFIAEARRAYQEFKDTRQLPTTTLDINDFLSSSLLMIPDIPPPESHQFYCYIGDMLKYHGAYADDCVDVIGVAAEQLEEMGVQQKFPDIWASLSDVAIVLLLRGVIELRDAIDIHRIFTPGEWDWRNDIKWYAFDHLAFDKSYAAPGVDDLELRTALNMSDTIRIKEVMIPVMSRIIAVSIVRSIVAAICQDQIGSASKIPRKWLRMLNKTFKLQSRTVRDELNIFVRHYSEIPFKAADIMTEFINVDM